VNKKITLAILLIAAADLSAQGMHAELTDDFLVIDSDSARDPRVGIDAEGRSYFVFTDTSTDIIQWTSFDKENSLLTAAAALSTTASTQESAEIAVRADGSFYAVWRSDEVGGSHLRGRYYDDVNGLDPSDVAVSDLQDPTPNGLESGGVATLDDDSFAVVWESSQTHLVDPDQTGSEIQGQLVDSDGNVASSDQFHVNNLLFRNNQALPDVARTVDGGFFVVWETYFASGYQIHGRRYQADGTPLGDQFQIETTMNGGHNARVAANDNGQLLVVWQSGETPNLIRARLFDANVSPVGNDFLVSSRTDVKQQFPKVAGGPDRFVVAWEREEDDWDVLGRVVTGRDTFDGPAFQVNTYDPPNLIHNEAGVAVSGTRAIITWQGQFSPESGLHSIGAREVWLCGIFCDSFE